MQSQLSLQQNTSAVRISSRSLHSAFLLRLVLFVGNVLHPVDRLAVQCFLNGDMRHCGRRCTFGLRHSGLVICPWTVNAQKLLLETSRRRSRTTTGLGCGAGCPTAVQRPAFAERGAITDLDLDTFASLVYFDPERVGSIAGDRIAPGIPRRDRKDSSLRSRHIPRSGRETLAEPCRSPPRS